MKNYILIIAIIISIFIAGCTSSQNTAPPGTGGSNKAAGPQTYNINIQNFAFSNTPLTIKTGDTITWTNMDSAPHTVTSDDGSELNSQTLNNGNTYSHTFNAAGTYNYHCSVHTMMKGTIIVQ